MCLGNPLFERIPSELGDEGSYDFLGTPKSLNHPCGILHSKYEPHLTMLPIQSRSHYLLPCAYRRNFGDISTNGPLRCTLDPHHFLKSFRAAG